MLDYRTAVVVIDSQREQNSYSKVLNDSTGYYLQKFYSNFDRTIKGIRSSPPEIIIANVDDNTSRAILAIKKLKKIDPDVKILVIAQENKNPIVFEAFYAGASGFITPKTIDLEVLEALDEMALGGAPMSPNIASLVVSSFQRSHRSPLSNRETEILSKLASGMTYKITADDLCIGMETVKSHVKNIYAKLHVSRKSEAIEIARQGSFI